MDHPDYVFISYAHRDSQVVLPCVEIMKQEGINLWYDEGIEAGSEWPEFIAQKVIGCAKFVLFISRAYLESQNCKRELNFAISRKKDILSVFLEDVELSPGMEMQLGTYQAIYRKRYETAAQFHEAFCHEHYFDSCRLAEGEAPAKSEQPRGPASGRHGTAVGGQTGTPSGGFGGNHAQDTPVGGQNGYVGGARPVNNPVNAVNDGYGNGFQPNANPGGRQTVPPNGGQRPPQYGANGQPNYGNNGQPFPGGRPHYGNNGNPFPGAQPGYGGQQAPFFQNAARMQYGNNGYVGGYPPAQNGFPGGNPYYPPAQALPKRSRVVAFLLALLLGGLGAHKFYLRQYVWGVVYLLFCATYIPLIVSLIEAFMILLSSPEKLTNRYKCIFTN